jgi:hypothetical protein
MTSNRSTTLRKLLAAIVANEAEAVRLVRATPEIARTRVRADRLVKDIPHHLYVGDTALHVAAAALRPLAIAALIKAGADTNAENRREATALHYACDPRPKAGQTWNPSKQRSVIELLLVAGSDVEHQDKAGATPLHRAVRAAESRGRSLPPRARRSGEHHSRPAAHDPSPTCDAHDRRQWHEGNPRRAARDSGAPAPCVPDAFQ